MQQTIGFKRLVDTHVGATALVLGVLVNGGLAVAGIAATVNLPWTSGAENQAIVRQPVSRAQMARYVDAKSAQLEEMDQQAATLAARAAAHAATLRFYRTKEEKNITTSEQSQMSVTTDTAHIIGAKYDYLFRDLNAPVVVNAAPSQLRTP